VSGKTLKDGSTVHDPRLGRLIYHDPRSRGYMYATATRTPMPVIVSKTWDFEGPNLDQGQTGTCVGHGFIDEFAANPVEVLESFNEDYALDFFDECAKRDPFPGNSRQDGTTVTAGGQTAKARGFVDEYRWVDTSAPEDEVAAQLLTALLNEGPLVAGTYWTNHMFDPDSYGVIKPTGDDAGGHCYLIRGVLSAEDAFAQLMINEPALLITNSWGTGWGVHGDAWIRLSDFVALLKRDGELLVPIGRKNPFAPSPDPEPQPLFPADPADAAMWSVVKDWANHKHVWSRASKSARAVRDWAATKGLS
jgi:C1A family cysteine protease